MEKVISAGAPWGSETSKPIQLKLGTSDYVRRLAPRAKFGSRRKVGVGYPRVLFHFNRALACNVCRARYCFTNSVRPSVRPSNVGSRAGQITGSKVI